MLRISESYRELMLKNGKIHGTQNNRGRNYFGDYGQQIANLIGKDLASGEKLTGYYLY